MLLILLGSCQYKELYYEQDDWADVTVAFDWQNTPDMDPGGMTVLFYHEGAGTPERYDFAGRQGGKARLQSGTWQAVAYNYDTETILYRNMESLATLEAYTRNSSIEEGTQLTRAGMPRAVGTEEEPVILEPDPLCGAAGSAFQLVTGQGETITIAPQMRSEEVIITIHDVPNLQYCTGFGGALSGLAGSVLIESGIVSGNKVTEAFTGRAIDDTTLEFKVRIFGHCPDGDHGSVNAHLLTVYVMLADGSKWYYTTDVTNQMHGGGSAPGDDVITIDIDELPIPKPIVNGSGFQPTIDGWQGIEINVDM